MGKLILISGPNDSGKSLLAESIAGRLPGDRYYIATMRPCTEDNLIRIEKHRKQRSGLGFRTLECPYSLRDASVSSGSVVLLEDVSNLFANAMFEKSGTVLSVLEDINGLAERCGTLIAVTISGLDGEGYDEETAGYINGLNEINGKLFELADIAAAVKDRVPEFIKGDIHDLI